MLIVAYGRNVKAIAGRATDVRSAARDIGSTFWHVVSVISLHVKNVEDIESELMLWIGSGMCMIYYKNGLQYRMANSIASCVS